MVFDILNGDDRSPVGSRFMMHPLAVASCGEGFGRIRPMSRGGKERSLARKRYYNAVLSISSCYLCRALAIAMARQVLYVR